jgi:hypothetical protein
VGYDRVAALHPNARDHHHLVRVVTNLAVLDFDTPDHRMGLRSVHPGVTVDDVVAATGFDLHIPDGVPTTRGPSADEAAAIERLDPSGLRHRQRPAPEAP